MIGKTSSDGRCPGDPLMFSGDSWDAQALVLGTEVVNTAHQAHDRLRGLRIVDQRWTMPAKSTRWKRKVAFSRLMKVVLSFGPPWLFVNKVWAEFRQPCLIRRVTSTTCLSFST